MITSIFQIRKLRLTWVKWLVWGPTVRIGFKLWFVELQKAFLLGHRLLLISPQFLPVLNLPDASNGVCCLDKEAIRRSKGYFSHLAKWWLAHLSYSFILKANYLSTYFKCAKSTQSELYWQIIRWETVSIYLLVTSAHGSEQRSCVATAMT